MALTLDTRQRAMLQEMGITVWLPATPNEAAPPAEAKMVAESVEVQTKERAAATNVATSVSAQTLQPAVTPAVVQRLPQPAAALPATALPASAVQWRIAPPVQVYPNAIGDEAASAWLVVWESTQPADPLSGEAGKLLDNMLRALRLHHNRHIWIAGIQRPGADASSPLRSTAATPPVDWQALDSGLIACMQQTRPARIVVLGLHAARAILNSEEALGRLRAQVHHVHATPVVVSYDPAYLLRSPHAKPAAWADLCRAHALHPPSRL